RLLPAPRKGTASMDAAFKIEDYTAEARVPEDSPSVGKTVAELEALGDGEVSVATIIRERYRRYTPADHWALNAGDLLLLQGEPGALEKVVAQGKLELAGDERVEPDEKNDPEDTGVMEGVVTGDSLLVGRSARQVRLSERFQVRLLAVSRSGERITNRLRSLLFQPGDVVVLRGKDRKSTRLNSSHVKISYDVF